MLDRVRINGATKFSVGLKKNVGVVGIKDGPGGQRRSGMRNKKEERRWKKKKKQESWNGNGSSDLDR